MPSENGVRPQAARREASPHLFLLSQPPFADSAPGRGIARGAVRRNSYGMKHSLPCLAVVVAAAFTAGAVEKPELDTRVRKLTTKFQAMQSNPDKRIPAEVLAKAQGIVLLDRTKGGFVFAYEGGTGVAMVRQGAKGPWGAGSFMSASEASLGFQVGGQQSFIVLLLMNTNVVQSLCQPRTDFGGAAEGTAGDASGGAEGKVTSDPFANEHSILVYSDRKGLYGGAAVKGGTMSADNTANEIYYGKALTAREILFEKKAEPGQTLKELSKAVTAAAKK